jgi:transposase-like protein
VTAPWGFGKPSATCSSDTKEKRCWWHKIGNVLAALPKSAHPDAKKALAEIYNAENREQPSKAAKVFAADCGAKWPKAAAKITHDFDVLLAFYDFPRALGAPAHHEPDRVDLRDRGRPRPRRREVRERRTRRTTRRFTR